MKKPFDSIFFLGTRQIWLEDRNINITAELADIADLFSDFKLIKEIREEMSKVNECMVVENVCASSTLKRK